MHSPYLRYLRNSRWGSPFISHGSKEGLCCFLLSASLHNSCIHTYSKYSHSSYLSWTLLQTQCLGYPLFNKYRRSSCFSWLSFIIEVTLELAGCQVVRKSYSPHAACGYRVKLHHQNIRNSVRQIIILYEKSQFNSLVWGLLTLAQLHELECNIKSYCTSGCSIFRSRRLVKM